MWHLNAFQERGRCSVIQTRASVGTKCIILRSTGLDVLSPHNMLDGLEHAYDGVKVVICVRDLAMTVKVNLVMLKWSHSSIDSLTDSLSLLIHWSTYSLFRPGLINWFVESIELIHIVKSTDSLICWVIDESWIRGFLHSLNDWVNDQFIVKSLINWYVIDP